MFIRCGTTCCSEPSGPDTLTRPGSIVTLTPAGTSMGLFPIRLIVFRFAKDWVMSSASSFCSRSPCRRYICPVTFPSEKSPDEAQHLAADSALLRGPCGDQTRRGGQDRHAERRARETVLPRVDPPSGLGHALQAENHPFAVPAELQVDDQGIEGLALLDVIVPDVALLLQEAGDLDLHPRARHGGLLVQRLVGVADAGEHVCDRIGQHVVSPTNWTSSCRG